MKPILHILILLALFSCNNESKKLIPVTYNQFSEFVEETGYETDAEKYGWSFVQQNVYDFKIIDDATWRKPNGETPEKNTALPVTQISYNDAISYCKWSNTRLPSYDEYWELVKDDKREIVSDNNYPISNVAEVNVVGNVWEITSTAVGDSIRLAGGSLFCSKTTCHGTSKDRELYTDKETGNIHIGFAVIRNE